MNIGKIIIEIDAKYVMGILNSENALDTLPL